MLNENIRAIRKSKGLSQDELAIKLNVVRQTVSKWENGLSVPDSDMLISISEELEVINLQLAQRKKTRQKIFFWMLITLCAVIVAVSAVIIVLNSPYLGWDYSDPETAVFGTAYHVFEWLFVRLAPVVFIGAIVGIFLIRKKI